MKNGLLKAFSLILALSIVLSSMSIVVFASDDSKLGIVGGNVELDLTNGSTVTVSVVAKEALTFYGIEGIWDINEQGGNNFFTLTGISSEVLDFSGRNYADEKTGELSWVDDSFTVDKTAADTKIFSATYKVAKNTPDGEYVVRFTSTVFTGEDAFPDETETVYEAVITVTHKCSVEAQSGKLAACGVAGWNNYYKCTHCGNFYVDAAATQKITDLEAWKLADGKIPALVHKDEDKNHVCDSGCDKAFGECVDNDKDHKCDYGCSKVFGVHEDVEPKDHVCDYGCSEKFGVHEDKDNDHNCDYGCIYSDGGCVDTDKDHECDYSGCDKTVGDHVDNNKDHKCDYGCNVPIGDHVDTKNNHICVYGCGVSIGEHVDSNKDHICDHGCSKQIGECEDNDLDHWCDYGCGYYHNSFRHRDQDGDHKCDYGCKEPIGDHADGDDKDHLCDYCFKDVGETCYDDNKDHKCDECNATLSECVDKDKDHACDYEGCKKPMGGDHVAADGKHTCDYCGKPATTCKDCLKKTDATTSTCNVKGNSEYYTCTVCGKYYSDAEATVEIEKDSWLLPFADHKYTSKVTEPTCEDKGYTTYTCSVCGDTYTDSVTEPTGHNYKSEVTASTCLNGGYTTHTCTVCGHSYTDALTDPTGHVTYGNVTYTWNADNSECTASHTCSCGFTETQTVTSTSAITTVATCTAKQVTTYTAVFTAEWIPEKTQTKTIEGATAPDNHTKECEYTINENGTHTKTYPCCEVKITEGHTYVDGKCACTNVQTFTITWVNGDVTKTTTVAYGEVPVVPEDIGELAKAPDIYNHYTFTGWGEVAEATADATYSAVYSGTAHDYSKNCKVCSVCNYSSDGTRAHKVGNPTCVDDAVCETCGTVVLKALGHLFTYNVTKCYWSTDDNGNHVYHFVATCSREDNCHETEEVVVIAVQQEEGYKAPTCIADGSATYVAAIPSDVEQSWAKALLNSESGVVSEVFKIEALGHELTETAAKAATCDEAGTYGYWTCGRCLEVFADSEATIHTSVEAREIDALGHDWKCKAGVDYLICNREGCDATTTEDIDSAHSWVGENETPATCTKPGEHAGRICSVCAKEVGGGVIQALGHQYGETSYVWAQDAELGKWICTATHTCQREGCTADEEGHTEAAPATVTSTVVVSATCTVMGSTRYTAKFDVSWAKEQIETKKDVPVVPHTPDAGIITKSPFYNKEGERTYYCTECKAEIKTEVVPATGVINISVLGDSITAFENYSNGTAANTTNNTLAGGRVWFPMTEREFDSEGNPIDKGTGEITEAEHIWIYRAAQSLGANILVNNSWSGSAVHFWQYGVEGMWQDRVVQLHDNTGANSGQEPDIIVVYMGTNDFKYTELVNGSYAQLEDGTYFQSVLGTFADVDFDALIIDNGDGTFTYAEPQNTMEAYAISFHKMQQRYPNSELYVMTLLPFRAGIHQPTHFNDDLRQMAAHFGVTVVEIEDTGIESNEKNFEYLMEDWLHPNLKGMEVLANAFESTVRNNSELYSDDFVNVIYNDMTGVAAMEGTTRTALMGEDFFASFKLYDQSLTMQITVLYGGVDITDSCVTVEDDAKLGGKIVSVRIENVTDEIEITVSTHKHEYTSVVTDPTCTEGGYTTYTCECGESYKANEVPAKGHSYTLISDKVAAEATCTTDAVYFAKCANCGDVHATETFAKENTKLGHSYTDKDSKKEASAATCTEPARNYVQCDRCDAVSADKTVSVGEALGHSFADAEYTWQYDATNKVWICTAKRACSTDNSHIETATATVTSAEKQAATCTAKGWTTYTASFEVDWTSEQIKDVEDIAALGHAYGETTYEWSNGNMNCTAKRVCKNDESHIETIEATVASVVTTEATCTVDGLKTLTATFVVDWAEIQTTTEAIPAKGHTETIIPGIPATCVEPGLTEGKRCNVCNTILVSQKWIPMIDHIWSETAVYTDNGDGTHTATYTCENGCNKTKKDAPEAHKYENGACVSCGSDAALAGYLKGDVDLDGDVDSDDLTLLARHVGGIEEIKNDISLMNSDTNDDGFVNSDDLTKHARYVGGIISSWDQE